MTCGSAGIGRQARLRILWLYDRVGSSPISRIRRQFFIREELFFLYILIVELKDVVTGENERVDGNQ